MKKQVILIALIVIALFVTTIVIVLNMISKSTFIAHEDSPKTYWLENATDEDKFERMVSITLYRRGAAALPQPMISSYMLPDGKHDVVNGELIIYATTVNEPLAIFIIEDNDTLVLKSKNVPISADIGARYKSNQ